MKVDDAKQLALRLRDPFLYTDACDEAADAIELMARQIFSARILIAKIGTTEANYVEVVRAAENWLAETAKAKII